MSDESIWEVEDASLARGRRIERDHIAKWLRARARQLYLLKNPEADLSAMALDTSALRLEHGPVEVPE